MTHPLRVFAVLPFIGLLVTQASLAEVLFDFGGADSTDVWEPLSGSMTGFTAATALG